MEPLDDKAQATNMALAIEQEAKIIGQPEIYLIQRFSSLPGRRGRWDIIGVYESFRSANLMDRHWMCAFDQFQRFQLSFGRANHF